jgi:hypothetical protein
MSEYTITEFYNRAKATKDIQNYSTDLNVDLMRQPGIFAYYSALLAQAEEQFDRLKNTSDLVEAKVDAEVRGEALKAGTKVTEAQIKSKVILHPKLRAVNTMVIKAKEQVNLLKGTCEALRQRNNSLIQLAVNMREEMKGGPMISGGNKDARHSALNAYKAGLEAFNSQDDDV